MNKFLRQNKNNISNNHPELFKKEQTGLNPLFENNPNQKNLPQKSPQLSPQSNIATPMMTQYLDIKRQHPDALLFYRMGDFYELFFKDAEKAANILNIALTKRGKHLGQDVPMCGVPVHAAENYLMRLIRAGQRIAICEQIHTAQHAHAKQLMHRKVVRIITQGTITEDALLQSEKHNYLLALFHNAIAWADISTGEFQVKIVENKNISAELARIMPKEILLVENSWADLPENLRLQIEQCAYLDLPRSAFNLKAAKLRLNQSFGKASAISLENLNPNALVVAGALLDYIQITQVISQGKMQAPHIEGHKDFMMIDSVAHANLELTEPFNRAYKQSTLFWVLNQTLTGAGARLLAQRLHAPLTCVNKITQRQNEIAWFLENPQARKQLQEELKKAPDILRALSRLSFGRNLPRDLAALRDGLKISKNIARFMQKQNLDPQQYQNIHQAIEALAQPNLDLCDQLSNALADEMPPTLREGGVIRSDFDPTLSQQRQAAQESYRKIKTLQNQYIGKTQIKNLKIKHNHVLGHYIEISAASGTKLLAPPFNQLFIHRQTLIQGLRFTTDELSKFAADELESQAAALEREKNIFENLIAQALADHQAIHQAATALAQLDVAIALAETAQKNDYCRPIIDDSLEFNIVQGRHPVVEAALARQHQDVFIANDCTLHINKNHIWLLTGPNMAGKSTFLRQNALIAIMAQMGCFVPAKHAHIGIIDRLFSRVGAADNLAAGQSTFMVEMVETATILSQATSKSFVIIDEIGRGTATFDGLALAWAIIEHLHQKLKCRAIFATHFHELTQLEKQLAHISNHHMKTQKNKNDDHIGFLHEVAQGPASRSYGVEVAKHAGLPASLITRAAQLLEIFEKQKNLPNIKPPPEPTATPQSEIEQLIKQINPENLSPRQALDLIFQLKNAKQK